MRYQQTWFDDFKDWLGLFFEGSLWLGMAAVVLTLIVLAAIQAPLVLAAIVGVAALFVATAAIATTISRRRSDHD